MEQEITALQKLINTVIEFCVNYSFQVVGALLVLIAGGIVANWASAVLFKIFQKKKLDITLSKFLVTGLRIVIMGFALLIALGKFGITIAPFVAALGAIAFGSTIAFQGPLSNYGAGLSIVIGRPFVVGDTITVAGVSGVVQEVKLASTILVCEDGVKITIPNKEVVGQIVHNSGKNKVVEGLVGISYDSDSEQAIRVIGQVLGQFKEIAQDPPPQIGIQEFGDSSIDIAFRYWVPTVKYFHISHAVNLAVYKALQAANIQIPFPQREVHLIPETKNI
jgi:small conductance mechanosensitive channel